MRHLTVILVIILLASASSCKYFKGKRLFGHKADTMAVWRARQDSLRVADSLKVVRERLQAIGNARLDSIKVAEEKAAWEKKNRFSIIVGSFITPDYAKKLADVYQKKGFETRIIKMGNSRFELVSAESVDNYRKAISRLKYFQGNEEVDSWIYEKK
ncbi:MAG: hypothetical protein ABSA76_00355 [Bacteroidales bacterium]